MHGILLLDVDTPMMRGKPWRESRRWSVRLPHIKMIEKIAYMYQKDKESKQSWVSAGFFRGTKNILWGEFEIDGTGTNEGAENKIEFIKVSIF